MCAKTTTTQQNIAFGCDYIQIDTFLFIANKNKQRAKNSSLQALVFFVPFFLEYCKKYPGLAPHKHFRHANFCVFAHVAEGHAQVRAVPRLVPRPGSCRGGSPLARSLAEDALMKRSSQRGENGPMPDLLRRPRTSSRCLVREPAPPHALTHPLLQTRWLIHACSCVHARVHTATSLYHCAKTIAAVAFPAVARCQPRAVHYQGVTLDATLERGAI